MKKLLLALSFIAVGVVSNIHAATYTFTNTTDKNLWVIVKYPKSETTLFPDTFALAPQGKTSTQMPAIEHRTGDFTVREYAQDFYTLDTGNSCAQSIEIYFNETPVIFKSASETELCRSLNLVIEDNPASSSDLMIKEQ